MENILNHQIRLMMIGDYINMTVHKMEIKPAHNK